MFFLMLFDTKSLTSLRILNFDVLLLLRCSLNKRVIFLFGLVGAGKSYIASQIADTYGYYCHEGDDDLTPSMKEAIEFRLHFTDQMRADFFRILSEKILLLQKKHEYIVVSQGLYKNKHRQFLLETIPNLELVWVTASDSLIYERLMKREGVPVDKDYAKNIRANFENPVMDVHTLVNEGSIEEKVQYLIEGVGR
jgi:gluconokinase